MDLIRNKLERINDFWKYFALKYQWIQANLAWDDEVKTNYCGNIFVNFKDSFDLIKRKPSSNDLQDSIIYATGLFQIIYAHQDLTDELLRIFRIEASSKEDKNPNREIRNELIGHPINKEIVSGSLKLKSSVFWCADSSTENLHYIRYTAENNFQGEEKFYDVNSIIDSHHAYLLKYFGEILGKSRKVLKNYSKQLKELENGLAKGMDFNKILELTFKRYEYISKTDHLYNELFLKEYFRRKEEHLRYKYAVDKFKKELLKNLSNTQLDIQKQISDIWLKDEIPQETEAPQIEFILVDATNFKYE
jgi:hypothetical protein